MPFYRIDALPGFLFCSVYHAAKMHSRVGHCYHKDLNILAYGKHASPAVVLEELNYSISIIEEIAMTLALCVDAKDLHTLVCGN